MDRNSNWNTDTHLKEHPKCCSKDHSKIYNRVYKSCIILPCVKKDENVLFQEYISKKETKYIVKYNFSLDNQIIYVPENSILEFDGGSFSNGTLVGNDTLVLNIGNIDCIFNNVNLQGTWRQDEAGTAIENLYMVKADKSSVYTKAEISTMLKDKADKSSTVSTIGYNNRILTKTINGNISDVVAASLLVKDGGAVTGIKVGSSSYSPANNIVSLPAYPTTLPASDVYAWAKASNKPSYNFEELESVPTTLNGYGITDAKIEAGVITLGNNTMTPLTEHQDISYLATKEELSDGLSERADKSEMSVTPGTGTSSDKTTIQLKSGTSATVLTTHQDISGKVDTSTFNTHADNTTIHITASERSTWNDKQNALVSGTNIKTINGTSVLGSGNISISSATVDSQMSYTSTNPVQNKVISEAVRGNKAYDSAAHSGLGRKVLELKNGSNILTSSDFSSANTRYIIRYDFSLNNATIVLPANCALTFEGGSLSNGKLTYNNTLIEGFDISKSYSNIEVTGGAIANSMLLLEYYGTSPSKAFTTCLTFTTKGTTILLTKEITLDGDVTISLNTQSSNFITVMGLGRQTVINANGYHFKGTQKFNAAGDIYCGGVKFFNIRFVGKRASDTEYVFDCDSLMRLYFSYCYFYNCRSFLQSNTSGCWMQSIYIDNCYCRSMNNLVYSIVNTYDIHITHTVCEASSNFVHLEGGVNHLSVTNCCLEGISGRVFYIAGNIYSANIENNYFESNGNSVNGSQLDLTDTSMIHVNFSNNFIAPHSDKWSSPQILLPTDTTKLQSFDNGNSCLVANHNNIPGSTNYSGWVNGVLVSSSMAFTKFLYAEGNVRLNVNVPLPTVLRRPRVMFYTVDNQFSYSTSLTFEGKPKNVSFSSPATLVNERDLTTAEMATLSILNYDDHSVSVQCNSTTVTPLLIGKLIDIKLSCQIEGDSKYESAL